MELSKKIVLARKKQGLTQEELAGLAHVTVRTIQRLESGETVPRAFTVRALARALNTDFEELADASRYEDVVNRPNPAPNNMAADNEKHFLQTLCLSCFSYLVIPFVHFLIPVYLLRKHGHSHSETLGTGRTIIRQQIYWVVALHALMLLTLGYNLLMATYNKAWLISYLVPFFAMYLLNVAIIMVTFRRLNRLQIANISV